MDFICLIKTVNMLILFEDVIDLSVESRIAEYQMRTGFFFFSGRVHKFSCFKPV